MIRTLLAAALVALPLSAHAAPPPEWSEDWKIMAPYRSWVEGQKQPTGVSCCSISDARPVDAKIVTVIDPDGVERTHWSAHIGPSHWPGAPDKWIIIPDAQVNHTPNPVGAALLWLSLPHLPGRQIGSVYVPGPVDPAGDFDVYCFSPPGGV